MKIFRYAIITGMLMLPLLANAQEAIRVDTGESRINWVAKKHTGEHRGYIKLLGGQLIVDSNQITGGTFIIDMKSIRNVDLIDKENNKKLTQDLKSQNFFDSQKYPASKFVITGIRRVDNSARKERKTTHRIEGDLTIKGITRKVSFDASINLLNGKFTASTPSFTLDRTDWGLNYQSKSSPEELKDEYIYDDVTLQVELVSK